MNNNVIKDYCNAIKDKIALNDYLSAMGISDKLVFNFPNCEKGYYYRGVCFFALQKINEAIANYQVAIRLNPQYAKAYFNLGTCYHQLKYYDHALINFGKALILFSNQGKKNAYNKTVEAINYTDAERME